MRRLNLIFLLSIIILISFTSSVFSQGKGKDKNGDNNAPQITSTPVTEAYQNSLYTYQVVAADEDGDALTYSLNKFPEGMTIDSETGLIQWTPSSDDHGSERVIVVVSDGTDETTQDFRITVSKTSGDTPPNVTGNAPEITSEPIIRLVI